ncbi:MAG TPA: hypothetical protein DCX14_01510 [Flavobacteriales bacterium]|nr:YycC family protein [Flavobacteriales bacterium]HAW18834.1 hypothetical protein [Flavobacteriales bacterium]
MTLSTQLGVPLEILMHYPGMILIGQLRPDSDGY